MPQFHRFEAQRRPDGNLCPNGQGNCNAAEQKRERGRHTSVTSDGLHIHGNPLRSVRNGMDVLREQVRQR